MKHLVILSAVFAILNHYGHLDWDWIAVVSPILVGHALRALRAWSWFVWAVLTHFLGSQAHVDAFVQRMQSKAIKQYEKVTATINDLHTLFSKRKRR